MNLNMFETQTSFNMSDVKLIKNDTLAIFIIIHHCNGVIYKSEGSWVICGNKFSGKFKPLNI
jgi:hypothetical protein